MKNYRRKIFIITAYRIHNLAPYSTDRRRELINTIIKEECFLSEKYPKIILFFNRTKPHATLWYSKKFKLVQLGRIANIEHDDALYTFIEEDGTIKKHYLNLRYILILTEEQLCDAESCRSLVAA